MDQVLLWGLVKVGAMTLREVAQHYVWRAQVQVSPPGKVVVLRRDHTGQR